MCIMIMLRREIRRTVFETTHKILHPLIKRRPIFLGHSLPQQNHFHLRPIRQMNSDRKLDAIFLDCQCDAHAWKMPDFTRGVNGRQRHNNQSVPRR